MYELSSGNITVLYFFTILFESPAIKGITKQQLKFANKDQLSFHHDDKY